MGTLTEVRRMQQLAGLIKEDTASDINQFFDKDKWAGSAQQGKVQKAIQYLVQGKDSEALSFVGNNTKLVDELKKYLAQIPKNKLDVLKTKSSGEIQNVFQKSMGAIMDYLGKQGVLK